MVFPIWGHKLFWSHIRVFGHPDNEVAEVVYADVKVVQSSRPLEWLYLFYDEDYTCYVDCQALGLYRVCL
jgi:hypothetical protein